MAKHAKMSATEFLSAILQERIWKRVMFSFDLVCDPHSDGRDLACSRKDQLRDVGNVLGRRFFLYFFSPYIAMCPGVIRLQLLIFADTLPQESQVRWEARMKKVGK